MGVRDYLVGAAVGGGAWLLAVAGDAANAVGLSPSEAAGWGFLIYAWQRTMKLHTSSLGEFREEMALVRKNEGDNRAAFLEALKGRNGRQGP